MSELMNGGFGCNPSDCASCGGGCGGSQIDLSEHRTITLTMEDDTDVECAILAVFPAAGKNYIALLPLDENGQNEQGEVYLYAFESTESGDPMLSNIEDDAEYEAAAAAFDAFVENARLVAEADAPAEIPEVAE